MLVTLITLLKKAIAVAVAFYVLALVLLYLFQDALLFPAPDARSVGLVAGAEEAGQEMSDGTVLRHIRFRNSQNAPRLIYFHGNGDTALYSQGLGRAFHKAGFDVLLAEYRGYGGSTGQPSGKALLEDAVATFDGYVGDDGGEVYVLAHSLGTGVASYLSSQRNLSGLALVSSYSSLAGVAAAHYPVFPVRLLFRNEIRSAEYLKDTATPVLFFHGDSDGVIPLQFGKELFQATGAPSGAWQALPGVGHNDILTATLVGKVARFFLNTTKNRP
ncbi:MAG: alpha/beta hydrolase [Pseudomonadota bacterium]